MKKRLIGLLTLLMVTFMVIPAFAADLVNVKTNSDPITGALDSCEKSGSMSFTFDAGTVLHDGDYFYADLPLGVTLCQSFDFAVADGAGALPAGFTAATGLTTGAGNSGSVQITTVPGGAAVVGTLAGTPFWFHVSGAAGASRVLITVMDTDETTAIGQSPLVTGDFDGDGTAENSDGSSTYTVGADTQLTLALFDTQLYVGTSDLTKIDTSVALPTGYYDTALVAPDNSLCVTVASTFTGNTIDASISSMSPSTATPNFLTFNPTNPEVAHKVAAVAIQLDACKGDTKGYVSLAGGQGANCNFDYETAGGYCSSVLPDTFTAQPGNKMIITSTVGNFGSIGDTYKVVMSVSGNGSYFATVPGFVQGFTTLQDPCAVAGTALAPGWTPALASGAAPTTAASLTGCAAIAATAQTVKATSTAISINAYNRLTVDVPRIVFDPAVASAGDQVTITAQLWKLPCGKVFEAKRVIAEYVATCASAAPTTKLLYPYTTGLSGADGWWFGLSVVNPSVAAGTATITVVEADGDRGTFTTAAIAPNGMMTWSNTALLGALTADAANTGTLGDSRANITIDCNFADGAGFGMMGNGSDSTGFTPYTTSNTWNN